MLRHTRWLAVCILGTVGAGAALHAGSQQPVDIPDRIRGAERVVVAKVANIEARVERNRYGDELIVSHVLLDVHETLKGPYDPTVTLALEGGTVGELTMRASDLPELEVGERGVFFLDQGAAGEHLPHLRGQGILKLDEVDRVDDTSLTLDRIRQLASEVVE